MLKQSTLDSIKKKVRNNFLYLIRDDLPSNMFNILLGENNALLYIATLEGKGKQLSKYMKRCMLEVNKRHIDRQIKEWKKI